jgi:hypothetical protein
MPFQCVFNALAGISQRFQPVATRAADYRNNCLNFIKPRQSTIPERLQELLWTYLAFAGFRNAQPDRAPLEHGRAFGDRPEQRHQTELTRTV